ncbi:MAG: flagellar basal-body rod protein FlgF [Gammaproteobacteria bacterium]|nr:flagellar basal-body rod protein FlgF [Gammaproteobacteria bacterium]
MDRMLYLAMSGASQTMLAQSVNSNNLANATTTGFKADLEQFRSMPVYGQGMPSRVYAMSERPATDFTPGTLNTTGRDLDMAIRGEGWIAVQGADGAEAYTRAGDLRVDANGILTTGAGHAVIGNNGGPIVVPPAESIEIGADGLVSIRPVGQAANALAEVDRIKLVNPDSTTLTKGEDGLMRLKEEGIVPADAAVQLVSGALEGSNVSSVEAMVKMIELQRSYEMQVKMMNTAKENDAALSSIMQLA